jgi:hypothetical protein
MISERRTQLLAAFCLGLGSACVAPPDQTNDSAVLVTDSAGVTIITNTGPQPSALSAGDGLRLDLRIGATDGDERYQFHNILEIAVHPDTREIVVADAGSGVMRVFDTDGQWLRTLGRRGAGPGETERPDVVTFLGDSVFAVTGANYQAVMFDANGALLRQTPLMHESGIVYPVARSPGGWFVWLWSSGNPGGPIRANQILADSVEIRYLDDTGAPGAIDLARRDTARLIARIPRGFRSMAVPTDRGFTSARLLWDAEAQYAGDRRGFLYVSRGEPYQVDMFDSGGRRVRSVRRDVPRVPVTDAMIREYESRALAFYDTMTSEHVPAMRASVMGSLRAPIPELIPPIHGLLVARTGAFWVERRDLAADPVAPLLPDADQSWGGKWDRFDAEGRYVGSVLLPDDFRPLTLEGNAVYGVLRDDLDVEFVARLELER